MKVTALIDDELIAEVKKIAKGKNITESLVIALKYYVSQHNIAALIDKMEEQEPMVFREDFVPYGIRNLNRDR